MFAGRASVYPSEAPFRVERLARDKCTNSLCKFVNYVRKMFYNFGTCTINILKAVIDTKTLKGS
jgi:hypothetical protein